MTYTKTFFVTYKAFVTPQVLLPKLLERFQVPPAETPALAKTIQVRTVNALLKWLELAPNDWDTDLVNRLDGFVQEIMPHTESLAKKLQNAIVDVVRSLPLFLLSSHSSQDGGQGQGTSRRPAHATAPSDPP